MMELTDYFHFFLSLVFVLALISVIALMWRRWGQDNPLFRQGMKRRLSITEMLPVDTRHKLILLKRDEKEHLILVGPTNSVVIENDIKKAIKPAPRKKK